MVTTTQVCIVTTLQDLVTQILPPVTTAVHTTVSLIVLPINFVVTTAQLHVVRQVVFVAIITIVV